MKLGVLTTSYPRHPGDPAGSFVAGHVEALRALGHHVDVIAAGPRSPTRSQRSPSSDDIRIASELFYTGGAPDLLERAPLRGALAGAVFTTRMAAAVATRARGWDSIIAHWLVPCALAALPSRTPLLAIAHGGDVHTLRQMHLLAPMLHALQLRGARVAFVSEQLRTVARDAAPQLSAWLDHAIVQPMGITIDRFRSLVRTPSDPPTILIASRLVALKGVDVAIAAMRHLQTRARLVIAGDGPERASLTAGASHAIKGIKGIKGIELLGQVDAPERDRLLGAASLVVVPSRVMPNGRTEGTPMIALEALAAGVPVVASAVGGLRELAAVQLVRPDDPRALAAAIDQTLANPPAVHQLHAAIAHLDWSRVAARLT